MILEMEDLGTIFEEAGAKLMSKLSSGTVIITVTIVKHCVRMQWE